MNYIRDAKGAVWEALTFPQSVSFSWERKEEK